MTPTNQLIRQITSADWLAANRTFGSLMEQKVAARLEIEKRTIFTEDAKYDHWVSTLKYKDGKTQTVCMPCRAQALKDTKGTTFTDHPVKGSPAVCDICHTKVRPA